MARQATRLWAQGPPPGALISLAGAVGAAAAVTPDLSADSRGRSFEALCDPPYRPTGGNAARNLFALLKPQRYQSPPAWRWSNPSIASQDPIDAALVPPLKRSRDVRHTLTALPALPQLSLLFRREPCPCMPLHSHTSSSAKIRRCCVDSLNSPPRADIRPMPAFMSTSARTARSQTFRFFRLRLWLGCRADRQPHREHRAFARLARHCHVATHHARELAGDGEAETGAAEALRGRGLGLAECLEQLCLLLRRHANAGIDHGQLDPVASVNHPSRSQLDLTLFGELAGITQQVEQYLPQPHGVHGEDTQVLLGVDNETVLVLLGKLSGGADDLVDQRC